MHVESAPIEFFRTSVKYPLHVHVFQENNITDSTIIPRHWHENIELTYRIRYNGTLYINGKNYPLINDSLYIINSSDIHEIHTFPQKNMYAILISISYDFMKSIVPDLDTYDFRVGKHIKELKDTIIEIKNAYEQDTLNSHIHLMSLTYKLVYYMLEDSIHKEYAMNPTVIERNRQKEAEIINYIKNHINEIHSVQELSSHFGYSREHFCRLIFKLFGITCRELLLEVRLSNAISLMQSTTLSLSTIAEKSGFPSMRTFCDNFRKYYGEHPRDYRKDF